MATGGSIPLLCLEGVPRLPGEPQDEASLTREVETKMELHRGKISLWIILPPYCSQREIVRSLLGSLFLMSSISLPVWVPQGFWKIEGWFGLVKREFKNSFPFSDPTWDARWRTIWKPQLPAGGTLRGQRDSLVPWLLTRLLHPPGVDWKDWCWSWNSSTLATWFEELTHLKRPWCWERFKARGGGDDRGWDGWIASLTQWTQVWVSSGSWWWKGRPGMLQSMGLQRVWHDWATELNWTDWLGPKQYPAFSTKEASFYSSCLLMWFHLKKSSHC